MRKIFFLIIIFYFVSLKSHSLDYGEFSCGEILKYEREDNEVQIAFVQMYMAGYIKAYNLHSPNKQYFENTDQETIFYLIVNKCKQNPKNSLSTAAWLTLRGELNN